MKDNRKIQDMDLTYIICECGTKILMVHDLSEMGRRIDEHALKHEMIESDPMKGKKELCRIQELLIQQVFQEAVNIESQNSRASSRI